MIPRRKYTDDPRSFDELLKVQERNVLVMLVVAFICVLLGAYMAIYFMYTYQYKQSRNIEAIRKEISDFESEYEFLNIK